MAVIPALEKQIDILTALQEASAKTLDDFSNTSRAVVERARRIVGDVQPWEIAQENIAAMIEETSQVARCYHPPPVLRLVLAGKERSPEMLCKCIDHLVFARDYLESKPSSSFAGNIELNLKGNMNSVIRLTEKAVVDAFVLAMQRESEVERDEGGKVDMSASTPSFGVLFHHLEALQGFDRVISKLGEYFNRTSVITEDVRSILEENIYRLVEVQLDDTKEREELQHYRTIATSCGFTPLHKHYKKGKHCLLSASAMAISALTEVAECLRVFVLEPLDNSFDVVELPADISISVFTRIVEKCLAILNVDHEAMTNPSGSFVLSRGEGVGFWGEEQSISNMIFIGLDLLEGLWKWKSFAEKLPGDNYKCVEHVDEMVGKFVRKMRMLLENFADCKGCLDSASLRNYARSLHRMEWLPTPDCSAHVSATNQIYMHKMMLTSYYGAMKVVMHGDRLQHISEAEALENLSDYMMRCVQGTVQDLETIAEAAVDLLGYQHNDNRRSESDITESGTTKGSASGKNVFLPPIFMLNNIVLLIEGYLKEPCFQQRKFCNEDPSYSLSKKKHRQTSAPPLVNGIIRLLEDQKERHLDDFFNWWSECFPPTASSHKLASIFTTEEDLTKSQRAAVKHWYNAAANNLMDKIVACRSFTVFDANQRSSLIEVAIEAVKNGFNTFERGLRNRSWSDRPMKWMLRTPEQWTELLTKLF
uniref:Exocyst subunit Exo70 family protein n=1 Tax=Trypanosoma congolense (strain IL3000) TaxID=1068625 RepID=G0UU68_TRYCI|nr:conserved hypothetical protein [Trypanosoma congolense IL3000]